MPLLLAIPPSNFKGNFYYTIEHIGAKKGDCHTVATASWFYSQLHFANCSQSRDYSTLEQLFPTCAMCCQNPRETLHFQYFNHMIDGSVPFPFLHSWWCGVFSGAVEGCIWCTGSATSTVRHCVRRCAISTSWWLGIVSVRIAEERWLFSLSQVGVQWSGLQTILD